MAHVRLTSSEKEGGIQFRRWSESRQGHILNSEDVNREDDKNRGHNKDDDDVRGIPRQQHTTY